MRRLEKIKEYFIEDLSELRFEARVGLETRWEEGQQCKAWRREKALMLFSNLKIQYSQGNKNIECCLYFLLKRIRATTHTGIIL